MIMEDKTEEIIRVEGVSFAYDGVPALVDINLSVHRGDFLAIIGPNGSGKTTLLKIMVGLLKPKQGRVWLFGQPLEAFKHWHKIGYIQQKATNFDPIFPISVAEVIAASLNSVSRPVKTGRRQVKNKIMGALQTVGLETEAGKPMNSLSGGQQQRVLIARALATEPEILLLDEPTTGIDYPSQENFYDLLGKLNKQERLTIVLVTHDYGIVNRHVNRVACLNQKLVYHGEHSEFCQSDRFRELLHGGHHLISHRH
ncbi:MAG: Zinc ABC transporter, ATP-binding protein ZnuC [Candidatus Saccharicenans subterraneus]|uniref:Zinc ABC transporter, ATP-binding protein ZnuC n=1 Tax=Candidatus Saccharicenans subterraneus TaxID=2508984 RepID=A0A3E2BN44_9BACT|nr:MAG: Zinc ABC transporter, ATP-binding protein ZnuC [Candidatus Saccharicenans subterraneum]